MHHIQKTIISTLAQKIHLSFSELKPQDIENKLFDYHLKLTIRDDLVVKDSKGYSLSTTGRKMWKRISENSELTSERAFSVLFMVIKNSDDEWLLYRRKTHPLLGRVGFMHSVPIAHETITETAKRSVQAQTGLTGDFVVLGSGYFRVYEDNQLESFTHFTLLSCENIDGTLTASDKLADYFWIRNPDFERDDMLPNMKLLVEQYDKSGDVLFFLDKNIHISTRAT